jgi:hypothetical protein
MYSDVDFDANIVTVIINSNSESTVNSVNSISDNILISSKRPYIVIQSVKPNAKKRQVMFQ